MRTDGLHVVTLLVVAVVGARVITFLARRFAARMEHGDDGTASPVLSEVTKHRRALASVIASVAISVFYVVIAVDLLSTVGIAVGSLVAPAAVLGAAVGFGAQRVVQDLLGGFFVITERQYGLGDLVVLTVTGATEARGTVEDVTLRVTRLRNIDGEVFNVPNGQIVKTRNLSKDWARAVVDVPLPLGTDLVHVSRVLTGVARAAMRHDGLPHLLLDEPSVMGVESIQRDTVCMRMVARTLPGKQFEAGRRLRALVVAALRRHDVMTEQDATATAV
ncbi:mechanosensitive ion channel family protein [Mycolicibacterium sp. P1-18]|nr:mechanosensitive ion channel family protein [Mycolicibacterium sp. P1-18]